MSDAACKRRRAAQDLTAFAKLIANPVSMGFFIMPANSRLSIRSLANSSQGSLVVNVNAGQTGARLITPPALLANEFFRLPYIERGRKITVTAAHDTWFYVLDQWSRPHHIATYLS